MGDDSGFEQVLEFWFGELKDGRADDAHAKRWFTKDPAFDRLLTQRFEGLHERIMAGEHDAWLDTPRGRLAYIIVLDQFSRNMFRDTPRMYASDERALRAALEGIERGMDRDLELHEQMFFYMPLMHSESLDVQNQCVALFQRLHDKAPAPLKERVADALKYAEMHRDIVQRFGRFPHRNAILDRTSTDEEQHFLTQPNSAF